MYQFLPALPLLVLILTATVAANKPEDPPAPTVDRVGFPEGYQMKFQMLRSFNKAKEQKVVTVYGNEKAASIKQVSELPYPYGSVIVIETASALKDPEGKAQLDGNGIFRKANVVGLHVMRREKGFGEA